MRKSLFSLSFFLLLLTPLIDPVGAVAQIKPTPIGQITPSIEPTPKAACARDGKKHMCKANGGACGKYKDEKCVETKDVIPCEFTMVRCNTCGCTNLLLKRVCTWADRLVEESCQCTTEASRYGKCKNYAGDTPIPKDRWKTGTCDEKSNGEVEKGTCYLQGFDGSGKENGQVVCGGMPTPVPPCTPVAATPSPDEF